MNKETKKRDDISTARLRRGASIDCRQNTAQSAAMEIVRSGKSFPRTDLRRGTALKIERREGSERIRT